MTKQPSAQIMRPTMEAVRQAQEKLRWHLDQLIEQNRPIASETERSDFLTEICYSTLGLGVNHNARVVDGLIMNSTTSVETVARWACYLTTNEIILPSELFTTGGGRASISRVWMTIRNCLFEVFPLAIERSCSISKEYEPNSERGGYEIDH